MVTGKPGNHKKEEKKEKKEKRGGAAGRLKELPPQRQNKEALTHHFIPGKKFDFDCLDEWS
jgi:hypothetical protein